MFEEGRATGEASVKAGCGAGAMWALGKDHSRSKDSGAPAEWPLKTLVLRGPRGPGRGSPAGAGA